MVSAGRGSSEPNPEVWRRLMISQVSVNLHGQCIAVFVAQPAGDGRDIHFGFNATGSEKVPQVVVGDLREPDLFGGTGHCSWHGVSDCQKK
jgi:hypothetical protein